MACDCGLSRTMLNETLSWVCHAGEETHWVCKRCTRRSRQRMVCRRHHQSRVAFSGKLWFTTSLARGLWRPHYPGISYLAREQSYIDTRNRALTEFRRCPSEAHAPGDLVELITGDTPSRFMVAASPVEVLSDLGLGSNLLCVAFVSEKIPYRLGLIPGDGVSAFAR